MVSYEQVESCHLAVQYVYLKVVAGSPYIQIKERIHSGHMNCWTIRSPEFRPILNTIPRTHENLNVREQNIFPVVLAFIRFNSIRSSQAY